MVIGIAIRSLMRVRSYSVGDELVFLQKSPFAGLAQVTLPSCVDLAKRFEAQIPPTGGQAQLDAEWITTDIPVLCRSG